MIAGLTQAAEILARKPMSEQWSWGSTEKLASSDGLFAMHIVLPSHQDRPATFIGFDYGRHDPYIFSDLCSLATSFLA